MFDAAYLHFSACGGCVSVALADPALCDVVRQLFPEYAEQADRPPSTDPPAVRVWREGDGFVVAAHDAPERRCGTLVELLSLSEFAITEELLARCEQFLPLHASGAVIHGRGVLALGRAGAGKSSLAISWHRAGHAALGDDVVLVGADDRVHPFKRLYEVDAELLPAVGLDAADTVFWEASSREAWYDPRTGAGWAAPASIGVVAVARYQRGASLEIEPLSGAAALNFLIHSLFTSVRDRARAVDRLARLARGVTAYQVTFGSAVAAAGAIADLVPER